MSLAPYADLNLGTHVGDDPRAVATNRDRLLRALPPRSSIAWMRQVHGARVVEAAPGVGVPPKADGCWTHAPGIVCAVMTADCLPVLLVDEAGSAVAAVHVGWRGLAGGVLEAALGALKLDPNSLLAWLGPAIGPNAFEIGDEVRETIVRAQPPALIPELTAYFRPSSRSGFWYADLPGLAQRRLRALGVALIEVDGRCTVEDPRTFFSYRRDGVTGRMASLILRLDT